jgi:hypothetical protein
MGFNIIDMFDDAAYRTNAGISRRERPKAWPKSASEMRDKIVYPVHGMPDNAQDSAAVAHAPKGWRQGGNALTGSQHMRKGPARNLGPSMMHREGGSWDNSNAN